jgi:hypothetical protein
MPPGRLLAGQSRITAAHTGTLTFTGMISSDCVKAGLPAEQAGDGHQWSCFHATALGGSG